MTLYLIRVGVDTKYGEFLSVICPNNAYVFIHVPETDYERGEGNYITYNKMRWNNIPVAQYVPDEKKIGEIHLDPEFYTFTYGTPQKALSKLEKGDILCFYAGFRKPEDFFTEIQGYYIFAYFVVDSVISYHSISELSSHDKDKIKFNHHYIQKWQSPENLQVIVKGNPTESKIFRKAVPFSIKRKDMRNKNYYPSKAMKKKLGNYSASLNLSSIRTFTNQKVIRKFMKYLNKKAKGFLYNSVHPIHSGIR